MGRKKRDHIALEGASVGWQRVREGYRQKFREQLRALMDQRGWHQSELARRAGVTRDNISVYLRGDAMPSRPKLEGLASAFGIAPEQLLPEGYFPDVHFKKATKSENFSHQKPPSTEFTLSVIEGSELVWLRVNKQVPVAIGLKIGAMLLCAGQNVEEV